MKDYPNDICNRIFLLYFFAPKNSWHVYYCKPQFPDLSFTNDRSTRLLRPVYDKPSSRVKCAANIYIQSHRLPFSFFHLRCIVSVFNRVLNFSKILRYHTFVVDFELQSIPKEIVFMDNFWKVAQRNLFQINFLKIILKKPFFSSNF